MADRLDLSTELRPSLSHEVLENRLQELHDQINQELAKGNSANFDRMYDTALKVVALLMRLSGRYDHEAIQDMVGEMREHVKKVQKTTGSSWGWGFTIVSAILGVGAGLCGLAPVAGGAALFTEKGLKIMSKIGEAGGPAAHGVGAVGKIFDEKASGHRYAAEDAHRMRQQFREELKNAVQQREARLRESQNAIQQKDNEMHRAFMDR